MIWLNSEWQKLGGGGGRSIKERAFCRLFFAKEQREALKGTSEGNLYVDFFTVR